jgi:hypothetical protein
VLGAAKVSIVASTPQITNDCHLGVNFKGSEHFVATYADEDEKKIAEILKADFVRFATPEMIIKAILGIDTIEYPPNYNPAKPEDLYFYYGLCSGCVGNGVAIVDKRGNLMPAAKLFDAGDLTRKHGSIQLTPR